MDEPDHRLEIISNNLNTHHAKFSILPATVNESSSIIYLPGTDQRGLARTTQGIGVRTARLIRSWFLRRRSSIHPLGGRSSLVCLLAKPGRLYVGGKTGY